MTDKHSRDRAELPGTDAFGRLLENSAPETEKKKTKGKKPRSKGRTALIASVITASLVLLIVCGMGLAGFIISSGPRNFPNVMVGGIKVGGLTKAETVALLEKENWEERVGGSLEVTLPGDTGFELDLILSGTEFSAEKAAQAAYDYGRGTNWIKNLFTYIKNKIYPVDVDWGEKALDEAYIRSGIEAGVSEMEKATAGSSYHMDSEKAILSMVKGAGEISVDKDALYAAVTEALVKGEESLDYTQLRKDLEKPDFEKILGYIHVEAQDAYFNEFFEVQPEVIGISFDIKEAEKLWEAAAPGEDIFIPIIITQPETDSEALQAMIYRDVLGSMSTSYKWSSNARIGNIHLAVEKINGLELLPGQTFSFNETVGQRTEEAGFQMAKAYSDGQEVEDIGGGICQVSSTLYCAQMYAQLKTTNRVNHYFKVDYMDYGMDATVSWKKPDYKFTNSREYPVMIQAYCDDESGTLTIEIWGTDMDGSYVEFRHTSEPVYDETWTETLIGYTIRGYRDIYDVNGNWLDTVNEPGGVYYFHEEDIQWPEEKLRADREAEQDPLLALEDMEQDKSDEGGYLFDPDEYIGGVDIYS